MTDSADDHTSSFYYGAEAPWGIGYLNQGLIFASTTESLLGYPSSAFFSNGSMSVEFWINPGNSSSTQETGIVSFFDSSVFYVPSANQITLRTSLNMGESHAHNGGGSSWGYSLQISAPLDKNKWTHVAAIIKFDRGQDDACTACEINGRLYDSYTVFKSNVTLQIYENGVLVAQNKDNLGSWGGGKGNQQYFGLGASYGRAFVGKIDELGIYNYTLSESEIATHASAVYSPICCVNSQSAVCSCIDNDHDGYGAAGSDLSLCTYKTDYDCNGADPLINPAAAEICGNNIDENCNGMTDDRCCVDNDNDGYGQPGSTRCAYNEIDCNDNDQTVYVGAAELCDGKDNNCNGEMDEGCPPMALYNLDACSGTSLIDSADGFTTAFNFGQEAPWATGYLNQGLLLGNTGYTLLGYPSAPFTLNGSATFEFWINPSDSTQEENIFSFFNSGILYYPSASQIRIRTGITKTEFRRGGGGGSSGSEFSVSAPLDKNKWTHVAVVIKLDRGQDEICTNCYVDGTLYDQFTRFKSNLSLQIYENGVLIAQNKDIGASTLRGGHEYINFGDTSRGFVGKLDEIGIYNHALLPEEIAAHAAVASIPGCCLNSQPVPCCTDNDGDGYGQAGSSGCAHPEVDCNDANAGINPGAAEVCGNWIDENCDGTADEGCPPMAFYHLDACSGNTLTDSSDGHTSQLDNRGSGAQWVSGYLNQGLQLAATSESLLGSNPYAPFFSNGSAAMEFWINPSDSSMQQEKIASFFDGNAIYYPSANQIQLRTFVNINEDLGHFNQVSAPLDKNKWTHVALVVKFDRNQDIFKSNITLQIYENGVLAGEKKDTGRWNGARGDYQYITLGSHYSDGFVGKIDEIGIYNHALLQPEIFEHASAAYSPIGCCIDNDGDGWNSTIGCNYNNIADCRDDNILIHPGADDSNCDGADDDCSGVADDSYQSTSTTCGIGACASAGTTSCIAGAVQDSCTPGIPAADDASCDGIDNNCNTQIDENYIPYDTTCGVGACASSGQMICVNGQTQDTCSPGIPVMFDTSCNGIDDNCNGQIDESYDPIQTRCGFGACGSNGIKSCISGIIVNSCTPGTPAADDATCNGIDDNCNELIDENYILHATNCGVGACERAGITSCVNGIEHDSCTSGAPAALDDSCNGIDDNCNGAVDEDYVPQGTTCGIGACSSLGETSCVNGQVVDSCTSGTPAADDTSCDGIDNNCNGFVDESYASIQTTCGAGACGSTGATSCVNGIVADSCTSGTPAADDATCNGIDDNCNGAVDENYVSYATTCGVGACERAGMTSCVNGAEQDGCAPGTPSAEICNGIDDNCDGAVDEDIGQTTCGLGECYHTIENCIGGVSQTCNPMQGASAEICDGKDNNCDGIVDNGLGTTTCGLGECNHAIENCIDGAPQTCNPFEGAVPESCADETGYDHKDNNCDGTADLNCDFYCDKDADGYTSNPICLLSLNYPILLDCNDNSATTHPGALEICDGIDNNCNIIVDEGLGSTTCGLGICYHTIQNCIEGVPQTCNPLEGQRTETCNSLDDNCNGIADELDADKDGVNDCAADKCLGSAADNIPLNPNQYAQNNMLTSAFESGANNDQSLVYNMQNTKGCTCKQIVSALGLGLGQIKKGCAPGVMQQWAGLDQNIDRIAGIGKK
jgi:hypothetical protein